MLDKSIAHWATLHSDVDNLCGELTGAKYPGWQWERIFIELITSDHKLKASRAGSKWSIYGSTIGNWSRGLSLWRNSSNFSNPPEEHSSFKYPRPGECGWICGAIISFPGANFVRSSPCHRPGTKPALMTLSHRMYLSTSPASQTPHKIVNLLFTIRN